MKYGMRILFTSIFVLTLLAPAIAQPSKEHNLVFTGLPQQWDEAIPLGNGMIGALVWQKGANLRISIDRADLWDLRPTKEIEKYTYQWAYQHKLSGDWDTVWKVADEPYDRDAAPTKIPGAALEFDISKLGKPLSVELDIASAICSIKWNEGISFLICIDATENIGRYIWKGASIPPILIPPAYSSDPSNQSNDQVVDGQDLRRLGYPGGKVIRKKNLMVYTQKCWGPLKYRAAVAWKMVEANTEGTFTISAHYSDQPKSQKAEKSALRALKEGFDQAVAAHKQWWRSFWSQSSISVPDKQLEKQWYLEQYKFGSASRKGCPPISLQAVWTADNGKLPPWKGDFHNDLNTQLSYWPSYSSNHLEEASVFTDWLWNNKPYFEQYTKRVFGTDGINVPGVATLRGKEMGGWHMYAMSPTVSCWLSQHFYLQWRYSMDRKFLEQKAYPWLKGVSTYLEQVTILKDGKRVLPMGSSPEFNDGGIKAWFLEMTNFDRALIFFTFSKTAELAQELGLDNESSYWLERAAEVPPLVIDAQEGLMIAPGVPYHESHRHFSHLMAVHPLGILDYNNDQDKTIILNSISNLELRGTDWWCGYSFSWLANIYARMGKGEKAADALNIFSRCFCSPNSFHLNGDQCKAGHSQMTYRPFTLEGNFAFAAGLQEMLLQSHAGFIEIFPAIPADWKDAAFKNMRAEGAFLLSAERKNGITQRFSIQSVEGGEIQVKLPFRTFVAKNTSGAEITYSGKEFIRIRFEKGGFIEIDNGFE